MGMGLCGGDVEWYSAVHVVVEILLWAVRGLAAENNICH